MLTLAQSTIATSLETLGFESSETALRRGALCVEQQANWLQFSLAEDSLPAAASVWGEDYLGRTGLWKPGGTIAGKRRMVCEIPVAVFNSAAEPAWDDDRDPCALLMEQTLEWIMATSDGELLENRQGPSPADLQDWLPPRALSIQTGSLARQAQVVCDGVRLALRVPLVAQVPAELSANRSAWLDCVLDHAQRRYRLVRLGRRKRQSNEVGIDAEVDLSGVPREIGEMLVRVAMASLKNVSTRLLETVCLLCDPCVECHAWEIDCFGTCPQEEKR